MRERESAVQSRNSFCTLKLRYTHYCARRGTVSGLPPYSTCNEGPQRGLCSPQVMSGRPQEEEISLAECNYASAGSDAIEACPHAPSCLWADTSIHSQTRRELTQKTGPRTPSYARDTITPSRERTSVLKRKSSRKPLKSYPRLWLPSPKPFSTKLPHFNLCL